MEVSWIRYKSPDDDGMRCKSNNIEEEMQDSWWRRDKMRKRYKSNGEEKICKSHGEEKIQVLKVLWR